MPRYTVQLSDGRTVDVEGDSEPTEQDVLGSLPPQPVDLTKSLAQPGQLDSTGRKPYPGFLKGGAFSPYQAESMQEAVDLFSSLQESPIPESKSKGIVPAVYNTLIRPVASPVGLAMIPALAESLPLRVAAGLGFGGMAAKSGLEKLGSPDPQTQLEGRVELASAPLMAFLPGAETKKGAQNARAIERPVEIPRGEPPGPAQEVAEGVARDVQKAAEVQKEEVPKAQVAPTVTQTTPTVPVEQLPTTPTQTGFRPAIRLVGGDVVVGDAGKTHVDIIKDKGLKSTDIDQRGFVDEQGNFSDREQTAQASGVPTTTEPARQHSTDLPEATKETTTPPEQPVTTPVPGESVSGGGGETIYEKPTQKPAVVESVPIGTKETWQPISEGKFNVFSKGAQAKVEVDNEGNIRLRGVSTSVEQRGKGIGRSFVNGIVDTVSTQFPNAKKITVWAFPDATGFWKKVGFTETGNTTAFGGEVVTELTRTVKASEKPPSVSGAASGEIVGMGGATPPEFEKPGTYVSNMFAAIDRDRAEMGKPPMEPGQRRTWDQDNQIALSKMNREPDWVPNLIKEVLEKPRPLLSWENAALVWQRAKWKAEANNAMKRIAQSFDDGRLEDLAAAKLDAARFEDEILNLDTALGKGGAGSEAGRSLKAQQMGTGDDFSLIEMRLQRRTAKGGEKLTPKEDAEIQRLYEEQKSLNERLTQHLAERDQKLAEAASREAFLKLENERIRPKASDYVIKVAEKWVSQLDKKADAARIRIRERLSRMSAGVDPTLILDLAEVGAAHIGHVGLDFAKWSLKMIEDFGDKVKPFLQEAFEASKKNIDSLAVPKAVKETIKRAVPTPETLRDKISDRISKDPTYDISPLVQTLARMFVKSGVKTRDALIDKVHELLKTVRPETTRRETMDLISGYGQLRKLSKDQVSVELRDLKGQMQQVAKLEDMANKKAPLKTGLERRIPSDEERRLIQLVNDSKFNGGYEITDPSTQLKSALQTWKTNVRNRMVDLQRKIDQGDFVKKAQRELKLDNEALQMQAQLKRIRKQWREGNFKLEQSQREWWQRGAHAFVKWERAFKLSSPVVFGKLAAAAMTRAVTTVAEEAVGGVQSKLPVIRRIASQAPREGGASVKAIADGLTQAILRGGKAAKDKLTKGGAEIEFAFGDKLIDKDWVNIFGNLHGAMKAPVVEGEFALSLNKRIQHAIRNGFDVTDPFVMTRLQTEALNDGYRAIFMQHGFFSDWFNASVTMAEKSKKYPVAGELSARAARFLLPIVRVPMNIVSETSTGIHGLATASMRTMYHAAKGTLDTLPPELADSIMRQFKKGSIGAGLIALGYLNPQAVGGYDWREKRKQGAVKTGGFQIAGVNIPRWMTHAPWFELMQFGATVRHVKDRHTTQGQKTIPEGLWAAALGLLEQTPFYGQMVRMAQMKDRGSETVGEFARSTLVPQAIQKLAELDDPSTKKRKAKTIAEHVKLGIPGLRETVKTTNEKR